MKRLFFVRHGETHMNAAGLVTGRMETLLTDNGKQQVADSGKLLRDYAPQIDYIICSPFHRTYQTAKIIASEIGFPIGYIERNDMLVERSFGVLEGTPSQAFFETHTYEDFDKVEKAETIEELQKRAAKALDYIKKIEADNILVVGHSAFGRALRRVVNQIPHHAEYDEKFDIGNAEILELT